MPFHDAATIPMFLQNAPPHDLIPFLGTADLLADVFTKSALKDIPIAYNCHEKDLLILQHTQKREILCVPSIASSKKNKKTCCHALNNLPYKIRLMNKAQLANPSPLGSFRRPRRQNRTDRELLRFRPPPAEAQEAGGCGGLIELVVERSLLE